MKRIILAGILVLAAGASALMAQQPKANQRIANTKSKAESDAVVALLSAKSNPDECIKAAEAILDKYPDSFYKGIALALEANAYHDKGDAINTQVYGERALEADPKNLQIPDMLGTIIVNQVRDNDLDKDDKLAKSEKYFNLTIETVKTAAKPNPAMSDAQWEGVKTYLNAEAHNGLGMVALKRKKYEDAVKEFKVASDAAPDEPAFSVRLASAYQAAGQNQEAVAVCDKILANPQLDPRVKSVTQSIRNAAAAAKK